MANQKSILITGAAAGIGKATAKLFAGHGWLVGVVDRDEAALRALENELGSCHASVLDITDREAVIATIAQFGELTGGTLDLLFSNAGIDAKGPFVDMPWEKIRAVIDVNLMASMSVIHAAWPLLKATSGALCLSTASASAIFGTANLAAYSASKHAIKGLTEALSVEFAAHGVRAADILPGIVDTGMLTRESKAALPAEGIFRVIQPEAVAAVVWQAYSSDRLHWYLPEELAEYDVHVTQKPESVRDNRLRGGF